MLTPYRRILVVVTAMLCLVAVYLALDDSRPLARLTDIDTLIAWVRDLGVYGPLLLVGLMAVAIVFNPLPSAPIALAAGAVYGHWFGTLVVVAGAQIGAMIAFSIARWAGSDLTHRHFGESGALRNIGSQNRLTAIVFVTRLIPFLSFDLISYAAGLSPITPWRFAAATLLGLLPMSFALAHFGAGLSGGGYRALLGVVLLLGLLTAIPPAFEFYRRRRKRTRGTDD